MNVFDYSVPNVSGQEVSLSSYKGKVLLIVNTASGCGLAPQFQGLEELYQEFKEDGLEVLGFPCNQFAGQEPLSAQEASTSCQLTYGVSFPTFGKIKVNGADTHPLYQFLKESSGNFLSRPIKWNFTKFLVGRDGQVIERFGPTVEPKDIAPAISKALHQIRLDNGKGVS